MRDRDLWPSDDRRRFWSICLWGTACLGAFLFIWWLVLIEGSVAS